MESGILRLVISRFFIPQVHVTSQNFGRQPCIFSTVSIGNTVKVMLAHDHLQITCHSLTEHHALKTNSSSGFIYRVQRVIPFKIQNDIIWWVISNTIISGTGPCSGCVLQSLE